MLIYVNNSSDSIGCSFLADTPSRPSPLTAGLQRHHNLKAEHDTTENEPLGLHGKGKRYVCEAVEVP